jgi:hypothetical protein
MFLEQEHAAAARQAPQQAGDGAGEPQPIRPEDDPAVINRVTRLAAFIIVLYGEFAQSHFGRQAVTITRSVRKDGSAGCCVCECLVTRLCRRTRSSGQT